MSRQVLWPVWLLAICVLSVQCSLLPYGAAEGHTATPGRDGSSGPDLSLQPPFRFYGTNYSTAFVDTFQIAMATDGTASVVILFYERLDWVYDNSDPLAANQGTEPSVRTQSGFLAGDEKRSYLLPGSKSHELINITKLSNVGVAGKFIFRVDSDILPVHLPDTTSSAQRTTDTTTPTTIADNITPRESTSSTSLTSTSTSPTSDTTPHSDPTSTTSALLSDQTSTTTDSPSDPTSTTPASSSDTTLTTPALLSDPTSTTTASSDITTAAHASSSHPTLFTPSSTSDLTSTAPVSSSDQTSTTPASSLDQTSNTPASPLDETSTTPVSLSYSSQTTPAREKRSDSSTSLHTSALSVITPHLVGGALAVAILIAVGVLQIALSMLFIQKFRKGFQQRGQRRDRAVGERQKNLPVKIVTSGPGYYQHSLYTYGKQGDNMNSTQFAHMHSIRAPGNRNTSLFRAYAHPAGQH
ncbi:uncharacterized protein [Haliotis cracherodii]|uniref:uncharacterized protein isoform X2 n=1 Tax=Haliotis cracherodii TaxID=6455 RepID=UPI0039E95FF1